MASTMAMIPIIAPQIQTQKEGADVSLFCSSGKSYFEGRLYCIPSFGMDMLRVGSSGGKTPFGSQVTFKLPKAGDALWHMYLAIRLPGIHGVGPTTTNPIPPSSAFTVTGGKAACAEANAAVFTKFTDEATYYKSQGACYLEYQDGAAGAGEGDQGVEDEPEESGAPSAAEHYAHYSNAIGHVLLKTVVLRIGNQVIDVLYSEFLYMWQQIAGLPGRETDRMVGNYENLDALIFASMYTRWLYVELPFWFTTSPGHVLKLVAMLFSVISVTVDTASLPECVCAKTEHTRVLKCADNTEIHSDDLVMELLSMHIWLEAEAREKLARTRECVIVQLQKHHQQLNSSRQTLKVTMNHPTLELIWAVRRRCAVENGDYFNFESPIGTDPIKSFALTLNGAPRIHETEAELFRTIQPKCFHSRIPRAFVYCYSFALFPQEMVISGSLNMSRFEHIDITIELAEGMLEDGEAELILFTRVFNLLKMRYGSAITIFSHHQ
jgi:hypothetical protein